MQKCRCDDRGKEDNRCFLAMIHKMHCPVGADCGHCQKLTFTAFLRNTWTHYPIAYFSYAGCFFTYIYLCCDISKSFQFLMTTNSLTSCCESSTRSISDSSAQTPVYCPVYESRLLATARHELSSAAALGVYGNPYTSSQGYGNYVTYGADASAFYSLVSLYNYTF